MIRKKIFISLIIASYFILSGAFVVFYIVRSNAISEEQYEEGFCSGKKLGYKNGYEEGYEEGYIQGQNYGYQQGYSEAQHNTTTCISCDGRGVNTHFFCQGEGCFSCDYTGLEKCWHCQGRGYVQH